MRYQNIIYYLGQIRYVVSISLFLFGIISCKKYLDQKPKQDIAVPTSLKDFQAILDNHNINGFSPGDLEFVSDNYYLTASSWGKAQIDYRKSYIWDKDAKVTSSSIWNDPYTSVYWNNFVLDQLSKTKLAGIDKNEYANVKGTALFNRSFMFFQLAQLFCKPYSESANTDLGIVIRLTSAVEATSTRSTVKDTYDQVISDLKVAAANLPIKSVAITRPNRAAAMGMLARVYLSMRDYINAGKYSDSALAEYSMLLDYNSLNNSILPYFNNNPEILYLSSAASAPSLLGSNEELIDSILYQSYDLNDLRKSVYFNSNPIVVSHFWVGSYFNYFSPSSIFDGIATDEIYLIQAECKARIGNKDDAMVVLNKLLRKRWKTGFFTDWVAVDPADALSKILTERRKELLFRGLRWSDLRRFNLENANITLKRIISGTTYTLPPNDKRWVLLIPDEEINRSGISQNPR